MTRHPTRSLAGAWLLCVLVGCDSPTGPDEAPFVGELGFPDRLSIQVPDTVSLGVPFEVEFDTCVANSCYVPSRTDVVVDGRTATVTPWDVRVGNACFSMGGPLGHTASITFDRPGTSLVRIRGSDGVFDRLVVVR